MPGNSRRSRDRIRELALLVRFCHTRLVLLSDRHISCNLTVIKGSKVWVDSSVSFHPRSRALAELSTKTNWLRLRRPYEGGLFLVARHTDAPPIQHNSIRRRLKFAHLSERLRCP